jgi:hypothetical protein
MFDMRWESLDAPAESRLDRTYNEETFHYFLGLQQRRSERSERPFLLLLVELKEESGQGLPIEPELASRIFPGLRLCLRETDFVGWYRQGMVAAAVLTELGDGAQTELTGPVRQRVKGALADGLPSKVGAHLDVSVYQLRPTLKA